MFVTLLILFVFITVLASFFIFNYVIARAFYVFIKIIYLGTERKKYDKYSIFFMFLLATTTSILSIRYALDSSQLNIYEGAIPEDIQIASNVFHDEEFMLREGCGAAIFEISETTRNDIDVQGLKFFENARKGRDKEGRHAYAEWKETPVNEQDRYEVLRGASCVNDEPQVFSKIRDSISRSGSYFTKGYEYDLLVVPHLNVVIFSHDG